METLIAYRQLTGDYGTVEAETEFEVEDADIVKYLLDNGLARRKNPRIQYQTKVIRPLAPEVAPAEQPQPFRDVRVHHEEPAAVVAESDRPVPVPDVSKQGDAHRVGRRQGR